MRWAWYLKLSGLHFLPVFDMQNIDFVLGLAAETLTPVSCVFPPLGIARVLLLVGGLPDPCAVCSHPWGFRLISLGIE